MKVKTPRFGDCRGHVVAETLARGPARPDAPISEKLVPAI